MGSKPKFELSCMGNDINDSSFQLRIEKDAATEKDLLVGSAQAQGAATIIPKPQLKGAITVTQER